MLVEVGAFDSYALDGGTYVEEILCGEVIGGLNNLEKLRCLACLLAHFAIVVAELHLFGLLDAQWAEAAFTKEMADYVEAYFLFKILWVY